MRLEEKLTCSLPLRIHFLVNSIFGWILVMPIASFLLIAVSQRLFEPLAAMLLYTFLIFRTWLVAFSFIGLMFGTTLFLIQAKRPAEFPPGEKMKTRKSVIISAIIFSGYMAFLLFPCMRQNHCTDQIREWMADPVSFFIFQVEPL